MDLLGLDMGPSSVLQAVEMVPFFSLTMAAIGVRFASLADSIKL